MTRTSLMDAITTPSRWGLERVKGPYFGGWGRAHSQDVVLYGEPVRDCDPNSATKGDVFFFMGRQNSTLELETYNPSGGVGRRVRRMPS